MSRSDHQEPQLPRSVARNGWSPFPAASSVTEAFAHVVRVLPTSMALVAGEQTWSYAELDGLSNGIAFELAAHGVARGHYVGIHMDRSAEAIIAMLAILKLGAVYVPFDPAAPDQRLAAQVDAAGIKLLTVAAGQPAPHWFEGVALVVTTKPGKAAVAQPVLDIHPLELAYVIHTSGSTNEAKGVCIPHRAILDLVAGASYCGFTPDDVVYHGMSIAFDGSTFEIWGALLSGARLVIAPSRLAIHEICEVVEKNRISVLLLSTGLFNSLGHDALRRLRHVRVLLAGGDVMAPSVVRQFLDIGGRVVVNGYGPTEVTTFSHCHVMTTASPALDTTPIGTPVNGTAAYLLDEHLQAQPLRTEGELFIAGTGLAQGYLGNPALTAERFLPDPFAMDGSRMYRTGDLAVQAPEGCLDYHGRIDTQVKIRGFRVELGEIESCLLSHESLLAACAIHVKNAAGASTLHAYCVQHTHHQEVAEADLRQRLQAALPDYMMPRSIQFLDALPLTLNGKVDRRQLESMARSSASSAADALETDNAVQDALGTSILGVLKHLLNETRLKPADNFFDVGGDSLAAMRFCAAVSDEHGVELPLVALFEADSLQDIVDCIRQLKEQQHDAPRAAMA
jgi:amino acid adenylation domain-containing protein